MVMRVLGEDGYCRARVRGHLNPSRARLPVVVTEDEPAVGGKSTRLSLPGQREQ